MEVSPLSQQARPESFQPKVVSLYELLFKEEDEIEKSEGFWQEFFLHKPDARALSKLLASLSADDLLHLHAHPQQLLIRAIARVKAGQEPADEHALDTLTVFLGAVLNKRYTNPSSDIISVLAGLHDADAVFSDFVAALDGAIRAGRNVQVRLKAVKVALTMVSGAYSTGLVSYFTHRDLFPALMKFVQDAEQDIDSLSPFVLLGLLVNYNKFEFQNPYRLRLDDFVNEAAIAKHVACIGHVAQVARARYIEIHDDLPEGWSLGGTLAYIGLGGLAGSTRPAPAPAPTADEAKARFASLPGPEAPLLLSTFDFANANKLFCFVLVTAPTPATSSKTDPSSTTTPFSAYLSLTSYLMQHAHRSPRAAHYTYIALFTLQILVEDQVLAKRLCGEEGKARVRLCRQRQPFLPLVSSERVLAAAVLDVCVDGINHNLRRRLDVDLYILSLGVLSRLVAYLSRSRTRLAYHWSELWRSLLSFIRFLNTYVSDIKPLPRSQTLISILVNLIALSLSTGESFLPDTASYDDLFYKLVETGDILSKFRDAYGLAAKGSSSSSSALSSASASVETLISVSRHYHGLLEGKGKKTLSPREVGKVIQGGYETLSLRAGEGLERWEGFREADWKGVLKRMARIAVEDTKSLVREL